MKTNKTIILLMSALLFTTSFVSCGRGQKNSGDNQKPDNIDQTTVIKMLNYDSGLGRTHLEKTAQAFSEKVKDVSYEEGKKGVYIQIESSASGTTGKELLGQLANSPYDMFSTEFVPTEALKVNGHALDITKYLKASSKDAEKLSPYLEEVSIYDRMYEDFKVNHTASDGKLYDVPLFMSSYNFYYDADLIETKGLYIRSDSTDEKLKLTKNLSQACHGVDGIAGTYDDGLPETYDQFALWLDEIYKVGCIPMHFQGPMSGWAMNSWIADFEGKDKMQACWSFDGTEMTDLIDEINPDGSITYLPPTKITIDNGYMVQKQEGRYRAIQMLKKIADSVNTNRSWVHKNAFTENHKESQGTFITSKFDSKPIALFAEGGYWECEASGIFEGLEKRKSGKMDRRFGVLPVPKYRREDVGKQSTMMVTDGGTMFVREGVQNQGNFQAIIDYLMFYNTNEMMALENRESAQPRPFDYSIDNVKDTMSYYEKSLYNVLHNEKIDLIYDCNPNNFTRANVDNLDRYSYMLSSRYRDGSDEVDYRPIITFHDYEDVTAERYFYGLYEKFTYKATSKSQSLWDTMKENAGL